MNVILRRAQPMDVPEPGSREAFLILWPFSINARLRPFGVRVTWVGVGHLSVGPWWCE